MLESKELICTPNIRSVFINREHTWEHTHPCTRFCHLSDKHAQSASEIRAFAHILQSPIPDNRESSLAERTVRHRVTGIVHCDSIVRPAIRLSLAHPARLRESIAALAIIDRVSNALRCAGNASWIRAKETYREHDSFAMRAKIRVCFKVLAPRRAVTAEDRSLARRGVFVDNARLRSLKVAVIAWRGARRHMVEKYRIVRLSILCRTLYCHVAGNPENSENSA